MALRAAWSSTESENPIDEPEQRGALPFPTRLGAGGAVGELANLTGSWEGEGLQVGFAASALDHPPSEAILVATREALTFAEIEIAPAESGEREVETPLPGAYFLRRSNDRRDGRGVEGESGTWLSPAEDADPPDPYGVLCLAGTLTEEPLPAMGQARTQSGPAALPAVSPQARGDLGALPGELRDLAASLSRLPLPSGITAAELDDPHALLRTQPAPDHPLETLHLGVSSRAAAPLAVALAASGLFVAQREDVQLDIDLWLQRPAGERNACATLLLSRRLVRIYHEVAWPHISVAAFRPNTAARPASEAGHHQVATDERRRSRARPTRGCRIR